MHCGIFKHELVREGHSRSRTLTRRLLCVRSSKIIDHGQSRFCCLGRPGVQCQVAASHLTTLVRSRRPKLISLRSRMHCWCKLSSNARDHHKSVRICVNLLNLDDGQRRSREICRNPLKISATRSLNQPWWSSEATSQTRTAR